MSTPGEAHAVPAWAFGACTSSSPPCPPNPITPTSAKNTTTPTPSLNSDSPAIFVSNSFGAPNTFNMDSTAIGSVGAINAPNSRHHMNGSSTPIKGITGSTT